MYSPYELRNCSVYMLQFLSFFLTAISKIWNISSSSSSMHISSFVVRRDLQMQWRDQYECENFFRDIRLIWYIWSSWKVYFSFHCTIIIAMGICASIVENDSGKSSMFYNVLCCNTSFYKYSLLMIINELFWLKMYAPWFVLWDNIYNIFIYDLLFLFLFFEFFNIIFVTSRCGVGILYDKQILEKVWIRGTKSSILFCVTFLLDIIDYIFSLFN